MAHQDSPEPGPAPEPEVRGGEQPDFRLMVPPGEVLPDGVPLEPGEPWPHANDWIEHHRPAPGGS